MAVHDTYLNSDASYMGQLAHAEPASIEASQFLQDVISTKRQYSTPTVHVTIRCSNKTDITRVSKFPSRSYAL